MIYRPILNRTARLLLEIAGVAVGGVLVIVGLAIWRLSAAPVEGNFIRPYLEQAINSAHLGFAVQLTDARLEWHGFRPVLGIHFSGVNVTGEGGAEIAALRGGTLGLSTPDLLFGRVSVVEIDLQRPQLTIVRDKDDRFSLSLGPTDSQAGGTDIGELLAGFVDEPNGTGPLGRLRRVHLVDGRLQVDDRKLGITWSAPDVDIDLGHTQAETTAHIEAALNLPSQRARIAGRARYLRRDKRAYLALDVVNLDTAAIAPLAPVLSPLSALAIPLSGQVHSVIDREGHVVSGDVDLAGQNGKLVMPDWYTNPLAIRFAEIKLHYTDAPQRIVLDRMAVDLGDANVLVGATATLTGPQVAIGGHIDVGDLPLARFDAVWPHGMAVGGRDWVTTHIPAGMIKSGTVDIAASGRWDDPSTIDTTKIDGAFDYTGMEVHYFPALPPIRSIAGHATFDASRMTLSIDSGLLGDLNLSKGTVVLSDLDKGETQIDIGISAAGQAKTLLSILDMPPLGYAHDLGLAPEGVGGDIDLRANFAFPAIKSLLFRQIALGVKGSLSGIAAPAVVGPRGVTEGALTIALDKDGMTLGGTARLSGVPVGFDWTESFRAADKIRSRISFHTEPNDADRAALALAPPDPLALTGILAVKGEVTVDRAHTTTLNATADLKGAEISIAKIGLRKPMGEPGSTDVSLVFNGDTLRRVPRFKVASTSLNAAGTADFGPDGALQHAALSRIVGGRNDFAIQADAKPGGYAVAVKGASLDAAPLLAAKGDGSVSPPSRSPHLDLALALDRLLTGTDNKLTQLSGTASLTGSRLDQADLKATAGKPLTFRYAPEGNAIALHVAAEDAGAALAGLGLTRGVRGGTLSIDGASDNGEGPRVTKTGLDMRGIRLTGAPIVARLVNAVSPTGLFDLLSGQGLGVDRLSADMDYSAGKITFRNGRSAGALGISFEGDVDLDRNRIAIKGTVVPADSLNSVVAAIPLLGDMLTGGNRGGFLGATYSVTGSPDDPKVSVNPLSMFAPGFLRNLFFLGPKPEENSAKPVEQPQPPPAKS
jgi:hypothetical protein